MSSINIPPPAPPSYFEDFEQDYLVRRHPLNTDFGWERVEPRSGSTIPCQRSLHSAAICGNSFYIFGGYDGKFKIL